MALEIDNALKYLSKSLSSQRFSHAYLITGQEGSGKEELVIKLISLINNSSLKDSFQDVVSESVRVIQPESKSRRIKVDQIRDLEEMFHQKSHKNQYKVGVIKDADRLGEQAENAFLKTLEEPPDRCVIFLVTAYPEQLLDTILSRCIKVPLMSKNSAISDNEYGEYLRNLLSNMPARGSVSDALRLSKSFAELLRSVKDDSEKNQDVIRKSESEKFSKTTDGKWLKNREEYHKAISQSRYLAERASLFEVLISWSGDALRQKQDIKELDFPEHSQNTKLLGESLTTEDLLNRISALEELRSDLGTNVQEALAIEVGFINAFANNSES